MRYPWPRGLAYRMLESIEGAVTFALTDTAPRRLRMHNVLDRIIRELALRSRSASIELLAHIQQRGIDVAIWVSQIVENTTYFACRFGDRQKVDDVLNELQSSGTIDVNFCSTRSERLFARYVESTEQIKD